MEPLISSVLSYDVILLFMCLYLAYKGCLQLSHLTSMLSKSSQSFQIATKSGIVTEPYYVQRQKLEPWAKKKRQAPHRPRHSLVGMRGSGVAQVTCGMNLK